MLVSKSRNGWELHTISNDKLSCENYYLEAAADIDKMESNIRQRFGSAMDKEGIMVGWDIWSGTYIMQMPGRGTKSGDDVVRQIYEFLAGDACC